MNSAVYINMPIMFHFIISVAGHTALMLLQLAGWGRIFVMQWTHLYGFSPILSWLPLCTVHFQDLAKSFLSQVTLPLFH